MLAHQRKELRLKKSSPKEYSRRSRPWRRGRLFDDDRDASVQGTAERVVAAVSIFVQGYRILFAVAFRRDVCRDHATVLDQPILHRLRPLARELHVGRLRSFGIGVTFHRYLALRELR